MDSIYSNLGFLILGITLSFHAFVVQSQIEEDGSKTISPPPPPPPSPPPPPPPPPSPPPPSSPNSPPPPGSAPPPPRHGPSNLISQSPPHHHRHHRPIHLPPPPPVPPHGMNAGKKVGLLFIGVAAIMQIGMVGFLVFKRKQLLQTSDRYENCS